MGFLSWFGVQESGTSTVPTEKFQKVADQLAESLAMLELAREDAGWVRLGEQFKQEFTREGLRRSAEQGRIFGIANPLIKRGRNVRHAYVWGQGVDIGARDETVNEVIQAFVDDEGNREAFYGAQARQEYEGSLYDEGNFFLAHFTDPLIGRVKVRVIPFDEIHDIITDPEDKLSPWFYERRWSETDMQGNITPQKAYYPALKYQPVTKFKSVNGTSVQWDTPVRHVKVNSLSGWKFGIGDSYAAIPWALGHKGFLEDWSMYMKAMAKIAYTTTSSSKSSNVSQAKRSEIRNMAEMQAGSTVSMSADQELKAVPKSGATIDSESSKPLATLTAAALDLPVTILLADPGQTGARATAETLDLPTRLIFQARQQLHTEVYKDSIGYAIEQAVIAPRGALRGLGRPVRDGNRLTVQFKDPSTSTVEITFPGLDEIPLDIIMAALEKADGMGVQLPPVVFLKLMLQALKVPDIDEIVQSLTDADGNYLDPTVSAGDRAVKAFRDGEDPAETLK